MWTFFIRNFPSLVLSYLRLQIFLQPCPPPLKMCLHHVCTYSLALSYRKCPFFARKLPYNGDQPGQRGPIWRRLGRFRNMFAVLRNEMIYQTNYFCKQFKPLYHWILFSAGAKYSTKVTKSKWQELTWFDNVWDRHSGWIGVLLPMKWEILKP